MNKIRGEHLDTYAEQMQEHGYSKSYVTTNLSVLLQGNLQEM